MTRFSDQSYIDDYLRTGKFPGIHDNIFAMAKRAVRVGTVLDLGACTGLLSARLLEKGGVPYVVAVEGNKNYIARGIKHPNIKWENFYVDFETLPKLEHAILTNMVDTIIARRVLPEIVETGGLELMEEVAKLFYDCDVRKIVIEGRKANKRATNPLSDVKKEIRALGKYYQVVRLDGDVAFLIRR